MQRKLGGAECQTPADNNEPSYHRTRDSNTEHVILRRFNMETDGGSSEVKVEDIGDLMRKKMDERRGSEPQSTWLRRRDTEEGRSGELQSCLEKGK